MLRLTIFIFVFAGFVSSNFGHIPAAQPSPSSNSRAQKEQASLESGGSFVTVEGRFAIALPERTQGFQRLSIPTPFGVAKGDAYVWQLKEGSFIVGHADASQPVETPEVSKQLFDQLRQSMKRLASDNTGALRPEKLFELDKHPALEQRVDLFTGSMIQRTYLVSSRIYQTLSIVKTDQRSYEPAAVKALDSFRILTDVEIASKRAESVAKAEPSPLPQEPVSNRVGNDASDRNLVGRVKTVLWERQELIVVATAQTIKRKSFEQFDEKGNFVRRELYDNKGNPDTITVYGYIDGSRVSNSKSIRHEYNPPPGVIVSGSSAPVKKSDSRYGTKYEFKYDGQQRLVEEKWFLSNGDLTYRVVNKYDGKQVETLIYSGSGQLNQHYVALIDEKRNDVERTARDPRDGAMGAKYMYTYEYDAKGNWIKRTTSKVISNDGSEKSEQLYVDIRTITYY